MEAQSTGKKNRLLPVISGIVIVILIIIIFLQYRENRELKTELKRVAPKEKSQAGLSKKDKPPGRKTVRPPPVISRVNQDNISDKERIKNLESQIADMQEWQDYLEDSLEKQKHEEELNNDMTKSMVKSLISSRVDGFAEEAGLSPDIKSKLFNMLVEKEIELQELYSGDLTSEDRKEETEYLSEKYDEMISDLLGANYTAYNDYLKVKMERNYINDFNDSMLMNDSQLDKNQVQKLVAAMYNDNQNFKDRIDEEADLLYEGKLSDNEKLKDYLETQKALHNRYLQSAREILSESQMQKFKKYLDVEMTQKEKYANRITQSVNSSETDR